MKLVRATLDDLSELAELFNLYRIFNHQASNVGAAREFLNERLSKKESVVFLAMEEGKGLGFAQLYPAFSSVSLKRTWILNDLYVKKEARGKGIGESLLQEVIRFAKETGTKGVLLETAEDNLIAQNLYEKLGFIREENRFYFRTV